MIPDQMRDDGDNVMGNDGTYCVLLLLFVLLLFQPFSSSHLSNPGWDSTHVLGVFF